MGLAFDCRTKDFESSARSIDYAAFHEPFPHAQLRICDVPGFLFVFCLFFPSGGLPSLPPLAEISLIMVIKFNKFVRDSLANPFVFPEDWLAVPDMRTYCD
eukprot:scaffold2245_cov57-Attheya_sp.AAC.1